MSITLETGFGYWNPLFWLLAFVITLVISWLIWRMGSKNHSTGETGQGCDPYISGTEKPSNGEVHIRGGNLYWGFTDALSGYYKIIKPLHTGNISDYMLAYLAITALLLIVVVIFQ